MFIMYVDEAGDTGMADSPTKYFVLSGLVVHELRWHEYLTQIVEFRKKIKTIFGFHVRAEFHAAQLINKRGKWVTIKRHDRLQSIRLFTKELASREGISVINVVVDKTKRGPDFDVFDLAWKALIQRFENTMTNRNFSGPRNPDDKGLLIADKTDEKKLTRLMRQMRQYNPIPNQPQRGSGFRNLKVLRIVEDPVFRDSSHSFFIQACDLLTFLLYQRLSPSAYMKKKSANNYFGLLDAILCKQASSSDTEGIVRL